MMTTNSRTGIYIHIPYCIRKCAYCDFLSFDSGLLREEYLDALCFEIRERGDGRCADTVYIGGGTPTLLSPGEIYRILDACSRSFSLSEGSEITVEANPGTVTGESLSGYLSAGINRISFGIQSFNDDVLRRLGRIHTADEAAYSYSLARKAGFDNISMDLMFAVPGLSMDIWKQTLSRAVSMDPEHISFYSLQIEEGTPFYRMYENGTITETDEETDRNMYHYAAAFLAESGYCHYEVSSCAKKGFESRHNLKYWSMADYTGAGLGASSFEEGVRTVNTSSLEEYINGCGRDGRRVHVNTAFDNASEFVFTGLRRLAGISLDEFREFTGNDFFDVFPESRKKIEEWVNLGFAYFDDGVFRLTLKGIDIQNRILMEFV